MAFKDLMGKAQELTATVSDAAGKLLEEFKEALPTMRSLGFSVQDLRVGMGLVPEIWATLVASADAIDPSKLKELIDKNAEKKILVTALKSLEAAYNIRQQLD